MDYGVSEFNELHTEGSRSRSIEKTLLLFNEMLRINTVNTNEARPSFHFGMKALKFENYPRAVK